jgi:hypothetical protein
MGAKQAALAKARQRRVALDQDRAARDSRVELAAAEVYVLVEDRATAEQAVQTANGAIGVVLLRLLEQESLSLDGVAQLCELEPAEVRRLTRTAATTPAPSGTAAEATVSELRPTSDTTPAISSAPPVSTSPVGTASAPRRAQ